MAKSLDGLIEFILGEVALCGSQGATVQQVLDCISNFYATDPGRNKETVGKDAPHGSTSATIDEPFQQCVWKWLTRRQDISVRGPGERTSRPSLTEALAFSRNTSAATNGQPRGSSGLSNATSAPETEVDRDNDTCVAAGVRAGYRIYVSEERMWLAICGHLPDSSRVLPLEFKLLSIIASAGEKGVIQGDLVKASGQDKRSVPNRTKVLQAKGYIEKRRIHVKGTNTSLLLLRSFAKTPNQLTSNIRAVNSIGKDGEKISTDFVDYAALLPKIFEHLQRDKIIAYKTLRDRVGMNQSRWTSRSFSRLIRRLEESGHVERVRARSKQSASLQWFYPSVKYIRFPNEAELKRHVTTTMNLGSLADEASIAEAQVEDDEELDHEEGAIAAAEPDPEEPLVEMEKSIAHWNPDRQLTHTIVDIVHGAGEEGITIQHIRQSSTGVYFQRAIESMLQKFVTDFIISQPSHLRHLAIVRDVRIVWKTTRYVHYTYDHFKSLVEKGRTAWEAIIQDNKAANGTSNVSANEDKRDSFGFPHVSQNSYQYQGSHVSLANIIAASKPEPLRLTKSDPIIVEENGRQIIGYGAQIPTRRKTTHVRRKNVAQKAATPLPAFQSAAKPDTPVLQEERAFQRQKRHSSAIGRPRKFLRGTEKFWQQQFAKIFVNKSKRKSPGHAGVMSNPAGLALFASRPPKFDETLIKAIEKGLQIPLEPDDINQEWVDMTSMILSDKPQGAFVSPKCPMSGTKSFSQVLVIKLVRLRDLNLAPWNHKPETNAVHQPVFTPDDTIVLTEPYTPRIQQNPTSSDSGKTANNRRISRGSSHETLDRSESLSTDLRPYNERLIASNAVCSPSNETINVARLETGLRTICHTSQSPQLPLQSNAECTPAASSSTEGKLVKSVAVRDAFATATSPQPRRRGRPKKAKGSLEAPVQPTDSSALATPQPRKRGRPRKAPESANAPTYNVSSTQPADLSFPVGGEIEQAVEDLGKGVTTRSGRELPKPLFEAPDSMQKSRKRKEAPLSATSQIKKRLREGEDEIHDKQLAQPLLDSSNAGSPLVESANAPGRAHVPDTSETVHEGIDLRSSSTPKDSIGRATQPSEPVSSRNRNSLQPSVTGNQAPSEETHGPDKPELNKSSLSGEAHGGEITTPIKERLVGVQGGTVALTRRNIIMSVIEQCRGAIPDGAPLQYGFITKWRKLGYQGLPDNRTIEATVKALLATGKVKRLVFAPATMIGTLKSKHSMLVRPDMLDIPVNTVKVVTGLRKMMELQAPDPYFPKDLDWDESVRKERHPPVVGRKRGIADIDESLETVSDTVPAAIKLRLLQQRNALLKKRRIEQSRAESKRSKPNEWTHSRRPVERHSLADELPSSRLTRLQQPLRLRPGAIKMHGPLQLSERTRNTLRNYHPASGNDSKQVLKQTTQLPTSLADILRDGTRGPRQKPNNEPAHDYNLFCAEVDRVQRWEVRRSDIFTGQSTDWQLINHHIGHSFLQMDHPHWQLEFSGLTRFDRNGNAYDDRVDQNQESMGIQFPTPEQLLSNRPIEVTSPPHAASEEHSSVTMGTEPGNGRSLNKHTASHVQDASAKPKPPKQRAEEIRQRKSKKFRRPKEKKRKTPKIAQSRSDPLVLGHKRTRRPQLLRQLSASQVFEIAVTVVAVRTLTGGIERLIDWSLVMQCLPHENKEFIKERWKTMTNKYRRELDELSDIFSAKYLKAYERDEIPTLDFDNLHGHDWSGLLEWAMKALREPEIVELPDLPVSRSDLEEAYSLHIDNSNSVVQLMYNHQSNISAPARETAMAATPFGISYPPPQTQQNPLAADAVTIARSWHRATVLAGDNLDDQAGAAAKFKVIPEETHQSALHSLFNSKVLAKSRRDQTTKKLAFHNRFEHVLGKQRLVDAEMLRRAAWFKTEVLDARFASEEAVSYEPGVTVDGDMLVIINLVAQGRVKLVPVNEPCDRYGLIRSYQTRHIPKDRFRFQVDIVPVESRYVAGLPVSDEEPLPPVPRGDVDEEKGLIPLWVDIHGRVDREMWQTVVAACIGLIAMRPGMAAEELVAMLTPALELHDAKRVVQWLSEGGFVKQTAGGGWETEEWWWAVMAGEKGKEKEK